LATTSTTTTTLGITNDRAFNTRQRGVLTVATDHAAVPYFAFDVATGAPYDGYEFDVARALASRLGLGAVHVVRDTLESIAAGFDCGCDVYLGGVGVKAALARRVDLSVPYVDASPVVLVRVGTVPPTMATAPQLRWAAVTLDEDADHVLRDRIKPTTAVQRVPADAGVVRAVAAGTADAGLLPGPIALLATKADPTLTVVGRFDTGTGWAAVEPLGSANSPSLSDLVERLGNDGTLALINRRHLGLDPATLPSLPAG